MDAPTKLHTDKCGTDANSHLEAKLYMLDSDLLSVGETVAILQNPDASKVSFVPPCRPVAGSIYVFDKTVAKGTLRCDQYQWRTEGSNQIPRSDPVLLRHYFYYKNNGQNDVRFRKLEMRLAFLESSATLVHYLGDHTIAHDGLPHGNSTKSRPFVRTCTKVKETILKSDPVNNPARIYRECVSSQGCHGNLEAVLKPRDKKQVKNTLSAFRRDFRISHDALYNLAEFGAHFPEFVRFIKIHPNLVVHLGDNKIIDEMGNCSLTDGSLQLQYDTTFNLGDFYVSTLSFRHSVLEKSPTIPVMFMIHERKFKADHNQFLYDAANACPFFTKVKNLSLVTDSEFDFQLEIPGCVVLHCWNHIRRDVLFWLRRQGATTDDITFYSDQLMILLRSESKEACIQEYGNLSKGWSQAFNTYFEKHVMNNILNFAGRWIMEPLGIYCPYSGITTNASEGLNYVLKSLNNWKEAPVDSIALSFKNLQEFYYREIQRGFHGIGNFHLRQIYEHLRLPADLLPTAPTLIVPEDIVSYIKQSLENSVANDCSNELQCDPVENDQQANNRSSSTGRYSQWALARQAVDSDSVVFVPQLKSFLVGASNSSGNKYAVVLFPKTKCQCPSTVECYHIIAAKMFLGMADLEEKRPQLNLTLLRKRSTTRGQKRSGRKKPRTGDYEVAPAPDSELAAADNLENEEPGCVKGNNENIQQQEAPDPGILVRASMASGSVAYDTVAPDLVVPGSMAPDPIVPDCERPGLFVKDSMVLGPVVPIPVAPGSDHEAAASVGQGQETINMGTNGGLEEENDEFEFLPTLGIVDNTPKIVAPLLYLPPVAVNDSILSTYWGSSVLLKNTTESAGKAEVTAYFTDPNLLYDDAFFTHAASITSPSLTCRNISLVLKEVKSNRNMDEVVKSIANGENLENTAIKLTKRCRIRVGCICRRPCIDDLISDDIVFCEAGQKKATCCRLYHKSCIGVPDEVFTEGYGKWICPVCSIPKCPGWGGASASMAAVNTCTIDNFVTALYLHAVEFPDFLTLLDRSKDSMEALRKSLENLRDGNLDDGKAIFMHFIADARNLSEGTVVDFNGSEYSNFLEVFKDTWRYTIRSECTNFQCPRPRSLRTSTDLVINIEREGNTPIKLDRYFGAERVAQCGATFANKPDNTELYFKDTILNITSGKKVETYCCASDQISEPPDFSESNPWIIPMAFPPEIALTIALRAPLEITVRCRRFMLRAVTLFGSDHFTALIRWQNCWFFYNGLKQENSRIIPFVPESISLQPSYALYMALPE